MLKVLLVDDEPFIMQGLQVLIDWKQEGYEQPRTASNGQEALEVLKDFPADLIIADINMPVKTGLEMLKELRIEQNKDTYVVILSGYGGNALCMYRLYTKASRKREPYIGTSESICYERNF